jgi:hypothetical protein
MHHRVLPAFANSLLAGKGLKMNLFMPIEGPIERPKFLKLHRAIVCWVVAAAASAQSACGDSRHPQPVAQALADNDTVREGSATASLVVQAQITLRGVVTDGPLANAKVVATVGEKTFNVDADAQGRYGLPINTNRASDLVMLTASGAGAQSAVLLTSLVCEVSGLVAPSGNTCVSAANGVLMG